MLAYAHQELSGAQRALDAIESSGTLDELDSAWKNFIRHLERAWFKTCAEMKRLQKWQGWPQRGRIEELRSGDPLLSYLCHARGAEEHGIDEITVASPEKVGVQGPNLEIASVERLKDEYGVLFKFKSSGLIQIQVVPATFVLSPVKNRGRTYPVPTTHLGKPLDGDSTPTVVGAAGVAYYRKLLDEIEREFSK